MIDEAEHAANASVNLNLITNGHGLALHMQFLGEKACELSVTRIQDYIDRPEVKDVDLQSSKVSAKWKGRNIQWLKFLSGYF